MKTIEVSYDGTKLILSDKGHTNASRGEVIHWHKGEGVTAVTNVSAKSNTPTPTDEFWEEAPHENGVNFKGKINYALAYGKTWAWDYDISCNVGTINNPVIVTEDPKIQVNPD